MATSYDTFHLFSKLPAELRLRIWDLNLPEARLIPIHANSDLSPSKSKQSSLSPSSPRIGCSSTAPIPANVHTCPESRHHALSTRYRPALSYARLPGTILLDFASDILYFPRLDGYMASSSSLHTALSLCSPEDLGRVRRLALHEDVLGVCNGGMGYWSGLAVGVTVEVLALLRARMGGLEELLFVTSRDGDGERLAAQVNTAMRDLCEHVDWDPPRWTVVSEPTD